MNTKEKIIKGVQVALEKQHRLFVDSSLTINDKIVLNYRYNDVTYIDIYVKDILCFTLSEFPHLEKIYYEVPPRAVVDIIKWVEQQFAENHVQKSMRRDIVNNY